MSLNGTFEPLQLTVLPGCFGVCRLPADSPLPAWATRSTFWSLTRTAAELSIVCAQEVVPPEVRCERGWRCLQVLGPLDFALTGVLASLAGPLAQAGVSLFALSTYDTDYLLVRATDLNAACAVLSSAGHRFTPMSDQ